MAIKYEDYGNICVIALDGDPRSAAVGAVNPTSNRIYALSSNATRIANRDARLR